jgi:hypothetical protein
MLATKLYCPCPFFEFRGFVFRLLFKAQATCAHLRTRVLHARNNAITYSHQSSGFSLPALDAF